MVGRSLGVVGVFLKRPLSLPLASNADVIRSAVSAKVAIDVSALGGNGFEVNGLKVYGLRDAAVSRLLITSYVCAGLKSSCRKKKSPEGL